MISTSLLFFKRALSPCLWWLQSIKVKSNANYSPNQVQNNGVELTWDEKQYACSKGFVKPVKGGVMDECHDANDDANETGQKREDHEGTGGI